MHAALHTPNRGDVSAAHDPSSVATINGEIARLKGSDR